MRTDLHLHTNASDANLSRRQLLEMVSQRELARIAITDHDTMCNSYSSPDDPVSILPACELSGYDRVRKRRVHLLCYLPKHMPPLQEHFDYMRQQRTYAGEQMLARVERLYPVVNETNIERYRALGGEIFRQNIMSVLMEFGYTTEMFGSLYQTLFHRETGSCNVGVYYRSVEEIIQTVQMARGVLILAHPSVFDTMELAYQLAADGSIDGIEIDHPRNKSQDRTTLTALCQQYGLIMTGGSDYHGANSPNGVLPGDCYTDETQYERLIALAATK